MFELTDEKKRVVQSEGHTLVMGGPGSGKTTIALIKADYIIGNGLLRPEQRVLFLSFARATISRVDEHAKGIVQKENIKRLEISTYHSFEWTLLRSHGYLLSSNPLKLLPPHEASIRLSGIDDKESEKNRLFNKEGLLHFDFFAPKSAELLARSQKLRKIISYAYPFVIVDEFQDTNIDEWALIKELGKNSTIIALADLDQRIYGFRGADPARIGQFIGQFSPTEFDFGTENNRSNGTDIVKYGNDLLTSKNQNKKYVNVKICSYQYMQNNMHLISLKTYLMKRIKANVSNNGWSLAVLVPTNSLMLLVSDFLSRKQPLKDGNTIPSIRHEVAVDEAGPSLTAIVISTLLEEGSQGICSIGSFMKVLREYILGKNGAKGATKADQSIADVLSDYITRYNTAETIKPSKLKKLYEECERIAKECNEISCSGNVAEDWIAISSIISSKLSGILKNLAGDARYIKLLHKGSTLNSSLGQIWRSHSNYTGAKEAVEAALTQEHFAMSTKTWTGINVMTIHKSKGKEFNEVIIIDGSNQFRDRLVHGSDPYKAVDLDNAKLNLRVAVTRAKEQAIILTPVGSRCPII